MQGLLDNVTQFEFEAAKTPLIGQAQQQEADLATWLTRLTNVQLPHSSANMWLSAESASFIKALTLDDVLSVARSTYFPTIENLYIGIGRSTPEHATADAPAVATAGVPPAGGAAPRAPGAAGPRPFGPRARATGAGRDMSHLLHMAVQRFGPQAPEAVQLI